LERGLLGPKKSYFSPKRGRRGKKGGPRGFSLGFLPKKGGNLKIFLFKGKGKGFWYFGNPKFKGTQFWFMAGLV